MDPAGIYTDAAVSIPHRYDKNFVHPFCEHTPYDVSIPHRYDKNV